MIFYVEKLKPFTDSRGDFYKLLEDGNYPKNNSANHNTFRPIQTFFTVTWKSSIRGMHFYQAPNVSKNLICRRGGGALSKKREVIGKSFVIISGKIFLAAIDLRPNSETFGTIQTLTLNAYNQVSIPRIVATGFQVISDEATVLYFLDSVHKPESDITINPISCGIDWPLPIGAISNRDLNALTLEEYCRLKK